MSGIGKALVVANGDVPPRARLDLRWPGWDEGVGLVVAADGGAQQAARLGLRPDVVVGDADSIEPAELDALEAAGARVLLVARAKDASDTELAVAEAWAAGARAVTVLGALGGLRFDHALANVLLTTGERVAGLELTLLDGTTRIRCLRATASGGSSELVLTGRAGDLVSLFPVGTAQGVTTEGLEYPLAGESLPAGTSRGLSNVRLAATARVRLEEGALLIVETTDLGLGSTAGIPKADGGEP
jgi:thiamine pyrophosphokinase